jgi:uncharacterized protein
MKFYNREKELKLMQETRLLSQISSKMTVLVGRRRIGKTRLIVESLRGEQYLYFFVARKEESLLCEEFVDLIKNVLGLPVFGELRNFKEVFSFLMQYAERECINLVIDEFQEFERINPAVYSEMQQIWDLKKDITKMNLILSGSVFSMMKRIFENSKEPLFGRANERMTIKPLPFFAMQSIYNEHINSYENIDFLTFYILTGGVPKYIEVFVDKKKFTYKEMMDVIFEENSLFLEEGKNVLIEEFGKEYTTYFSILSLIASSKTSRTEIESILKKDIGGYLHRLDAEYGIIKQVMPMFAKPGSRSIKYFIDDNFLSFWFRFIFKNKGAVEIGNFEYLKTLVKRDFSTFSGPFLEKYFTEKLASTGEFSSIGRYWETGNVNEIDIVAINDMEKKVLFAEVKLNSKNYSETQLRLKTANIQRLLGGYKMDYRCFSLEDI